MVDFQSPIQKFSKHHQRILQLKLAIPEPSRKKLSTLPKKIHGSLADLDRKLYRRKAVGVEQDLSRKSLTVIFASGPDWHMPAGVSYLLSDVMEILQQHYTMDLISLRLITKSGLTYTGYVTSVITGGTNSTTCITENDQTTTKHSYQPEIVSHIIDWIRSD